MADEESELLLELERIDSWLLYYQEENFIESIQARKREEELQKFRLECAWIAEGLSENQVRGRDLDWLKCYSRSDLQTITDDFKNKIRDILYGTLFHGKIGGRDVVVKTWRFRYFLDLLVINRHPARFQKAIKFFMDERNNAHESLPKLIGYTIEKKLALVYDIKTSRALSEELESGNIGWEDRLNVAFKLAKLLQWFHSKLYVVGAVDAKYILVDEKYNVTFYEFDLLARIANIDYVIPGESLPRDGYTAFAPDPFTMGWGVKSDVYAYGAVLFLLIMKKNGEFDDHLHFVEKAQAQFQREEFSLVDGCFKQESGVGIEITKLVLSCLDREPQKRPYITEVASKLESLVCSQNGKAKRKRDSSGQEQGISPQGP